MRTGMVELQCG